MGWDSNLGLLVAKQAVIKEVPLVFTNIPLTEYETKDSFDTQLFDTFLLDTYLFDTDLFDTDLFDTDLFDTEAWLSGAEYKT